jgi:hypothetical protein
MSSAYSRRYRMKQEWLTRGICLAEIVFIMHFTKLGIINRIFVTGCCVSATYMWKKHTAYMHIVEDQATQLTLSGQEARIQLRLFFPEHPQLDNFVELCDRYRKLSKEQLEKHLAQFKRIQERRGTEQRLDNEFMEKLRLADEEEDYDLSLDDELPIKKPIKQ